MNLYLVFTLIRGIEFLKGFFGFFILTLCRFFIIITGFFQILRNPFSLFIHNRQLMLCCGISLSC